MKTPPSSVGLLQYCYQYAYSSPLQVSDGPIAFSAQLEDLPPSAMDDADASCDQALCVNPRAVYQGVLWQARLLISTTW